MKKTLYFILLMLLYTGNAANGRGEKDAPLPEVASEVDDDEGEIGNFDFLYYGSDDYDQTGLRIEDIMDEAFSHLGTRYRSGSKGPSAFDCSGFTSYVYKQRTDIFIGSSSREQYARNTPITRSELRCGDLVFFSSPRSGRGVGHVGIVVDVDPITQAFSFIHASSTSGVKVSQSTDSNYSRRYIGARRVKEQ